MRKKTELEQWGPIDGKVLYPSFWFWATAKRVYKKTGLAWPTYYGVYDHDRMTYFWSKPEMQQKGELALKKAIFNKKKCRELWGKYLSACGDALSLKSLNIPAENKFKLLVDYFLDVWTYALVAEVANFASPDYLRKQLTRHVPAGQIDQALEIMMAPEKLSFLQIGEQTLLLVALKAKSNPDLRQKLKQYAKEWYWLENNYYQNKVLTADYFYGQIKNLSKKEIATKLKSVSRYERQVHKKKLAAAKKFNLPAKLMAEVRQAAFSLWWQDQRKAVVWQIGGLADEMVEKISEKYKLKINDIYHYNAEEWQRLWRSGTKVYRKEINQRKDFFALVVRNGGYKFFYGERAEVIRKLLSEQDKIGGHNLVKGIVVSRTKNNIIKGTIRIVTSPRYANKMRPGDILVAPMTSPDFIVAMRMAKAIITDVGGLMSHAAVVSRELHIPCIVNTKIATKVFKDGDLVEVDAEKGIVKILKKRK